MFELNMYSECIMDENNSRHEKEEASFEALSFLVNHNIRLASSLYDKTEKRRGNVLTVMSFCLIGEITFIAANFNVMVIHWWSWIIALVVLVTWLSAFVITIRLRLQMTEIVLYPTGDHDIKFLPYAKELNEFDKKRIVCQDALSKYIMTKYFDRKTSTVDAAEDIGVLERQYYEAVGREDDSLNFSKNMWLADSTIEVIHSIKLGQWARGRFKIIYVIFAANITLFFGLIFALGISSCIGYYFF